MRENAADLAADEPQLARVLAQPRDGRVLERVRADRNAADEPVGEPAARLFDDVRHLLHEARDMADIAAQERADAEDGEDE